MNPWEICTNIVLLVAFLLFNYSFWSGQWSKSKTDSQGLLEWCFNADGKRCCQSVSENEIHTQVWFHHFQNSVSGAWVFIALTLIIAPYCTVIEWKEGKIYALVLLSLSCFSSAVCLMVAVCVYGTHFKSTISLKHHNLHSSFGIAIVCLLLYIFTGISTSIYIFKREKPLNNYCGSIRTWFRKKRNKEIQSTADSLDDNFTRGYARLGLKKKRKRTIELTVRNLQVITLDENCCEYKTVEKNFKTNNGNFELIEISRIENKRLYEAHSSYDRNLMVNAKRQYPNSYKRILWHGTSREASNNINETGFSRNYQGKNACLYGGGVHFTTDPSIACQNKYSVPDRSGIKCVYQCNVLVGRYGKGTKDMIEPPKDRFGVRYDSTVNDTNYPTEHVIFSDNQAYPRYLIEFKVLYEFDQHPGHITQVHNQGFKGKWEQMVGSNNLLMVQLDENTEEFHKIETGFLQNNNYFQIKQIFRIQNSRMYDAHISFKKVFMETARQEYPQSYRKYLWHGTSVECIANINQYGFNRNYQGKNACFYGDGVYFATEPSYSSSDTFSVPDGNGDKFVYKCSVYVGRYGNGDQYMKEPPKDINDVRYDSTVDNVNDPKIHVMFRDNQAYPQYLIKFKWVRY